MHGEGDQQPVDPALVAYLDKKFAEMNLDKKFDDMKRELTDEIRELKKQFNELKHDLSESHKTIAMLRKTLGEQKLVHDDLAQYTRRQSVRVGGIPVLPGEDHKDFDRKKLLEAVNTAIAEINPAKKIEPTDVNRFHRSGKPRFDEASGIRTQQVLIQFKYWEPRAALHGFNKGLFNTDHKIRIYPDLTKRRLDVLSECRNILKNRNLASRDVFCYTDINSNLKLRANNNVYSFNTIEELENKLAESHLNFVPGHTSSFAAQQSFAERIVQQDWSTPVA